VIAIGQAGKNELSIAELNRLQELVIENADKAISIACELTGALLTDYTAAPVYFTANNKGGHEWLIEFDREPNDATVFAEELDKQLKLLNSDYEAKRFKDMAMVAPKIHHLPKGSFHNWLKKAGKLGGQHKFPRVLKGKQLEAFETFIRNK
jgi:hypothetical protein